MKKLLVLILISPLSIFAQPSQPGNWLAYFGDKKINSKWNWHHEVQYRHWSMFLAKRQLRPKMMGSFQLTNTVGN